LKIFAGVAGIDIALDSLSAFLTRLDSVVFGIGEGSGISVLKGRQVVGIFVVKIFQLMPSIRYPRLFQDCPH
jgi:hypothetical protein